MKRNDHIPLKLLLWIMLFISSLGTQAADSILIQLKWKHQFQFAGYYAALRQHYFEKAGLAVKLIEGGPQLSPVDAVLKGQTQYAVSSSEIITNFVQGSPLCVTAVIFQHSPYILLTSKNSGISKPTDLIGKRIMADEDQGWTQIKAIFLKEGINPELLKVEAHKWGFNHLINGEADAMSAYRSFEPFMLKQQGIETRQIRPSDYGVDFYGDLLFTTQDYAAKNREEIEQVTTAVVKGWEYAFAHEDEMIAYILSLPGAKERGLTPYVLKNEARVLKELVQPDLIAIGHMNTGRWQTILNIYKQLGLAPKAATLNGFLFETNPNEYRQKFQYVFYISLILVIALLIILFYNYQLTKEVANRTRDLVQTTDELRLSNTELEKFAYVASHNLRAPVVNMVSLVGLYNKDNPMDADNRYIIDQLALTGQKLQLIMNDLTQVVSSRINKDETGEPINLAVQLQTCLDLLSELLNSNNVSIKTDFSVPEITYNKRVFNNICVNLLTNAIKYRNPEKPLEIIVSSRTIDNFTEIKFADNGIGINMEKNGHKLFGLFQRFNPEVEGSGIGLYIIKRQIETLGGTIRAESAPGLGTTFIIQLKSLRH